MQRLALSTLALAALFLGIRAPAFAQSAGNGFLFHAPDATVSIRGGYSRAMAGSDVFDEVTNELTLDRGDFSSLTFGGDVAFPVSDRLDVMLSAGFSRSQHSSEFRNLVDNND